MNAPKIKVSFLSVGAIILFSLILDQITKLVVVRNIPYRGEIEVIPGFFNLVYIRNRGAAFGFLSGAQGDHWPIIFLTLTLIATAMVVFLLVQTIRQKQPISFALALILGGALGNLCDRIFRSGSVVDFIDLHIRQAHWPAFNVADSSITIGGILLLLHLILSSAPPLKTSDSS